MSLLDVVPSHFNRWHNQRDVNTGRAPVVTLSPGDVMSFAELPVGAAFRMFAGKWHMRKLTHTTAQRLGQVVLDLAREFSGDERCVVITEDR